MPPSLVHPLPKTELLLTLATPKLTVLETFPQLIGYDPDVYNYFAEQTHLCGFDLNLTYPQQGGHFPTLLNGWESDEGFVRSLTKDFLKDRKAALRALAAKAAQVPPTPAGRQLGRRSLEDRGNGTIDSFYRCALFEEMWDYALNYTVPWSELSK
jgi:carboxypeptidase D